MILPYNHFDGIPTLRDSDIQSLYDRMVKEGTAQIVFSDGTVKDSSDFVIAMKSTGTIFIVSKVGKDYAGMAWLNRIDYAQHRAWVHFTLFSAYWGKDSTAIGKEMANYLLNLKRENVYVFEYFMGICPSSNRSAIDFMVRCGGTIVGEIPTWNHGLQACVAGTMIYYRRHE